MPTGPGPHGILNVAVQNITIPNAQTTCYSATGTLMVAGNGTTFKVDSGGSATFIAGHKIDFFPGTLVSRAGYMRGYITTNNQYCGVLSPTKAGKDLIAEKQPLTPGQPFFKVYPNPTTGIFIVERSDKRSSGNIQVEIYRMQGGKLLTKDAAGIGAHEFDLSGQPAGINFVRLVSGNQTETVKVIRQ